MADLTRALAIGAAVRNGETSATQAVERALARIATLDAQINAFTAVTAERARCQARRIDALDAASRARMPLAGVPFAVKNLFDLEGLPTLAGSALHVRRAPAQRDALLVQRLSEAGAICVGALNMDAYAYGFTTENTHFGATRNPHDTARSAGGSSGGSGAAVAADLAPVTLGSDTNGSIRVPSSLCGVFGLKPTYGRLPRSGSYPFVGSLDHLGPFTRSAADLALVYDAMQGHDSRDPVCAKRPVEPALPQLALGIEGLRVARLSGYFDAFATPVARAASLRAAEALGARESVELPNVDLARAAAFVITASEGGELHLETLKRHYDGFEPNARDRLLAGAMTPAAWYLKAQRFRAWFRARARALFERVDVLVAPATPIPAPVLGEEWLELDAARLPLRPSLGLLTQPISFIGLPVAAVPIADAGALPIGVQLIAPAWHEDWCLRAAAHLERIGVASAPVARNFA